jgi:hypothetical protein
MSGEETEEQSDQGVPCQVERLAGRGCHVGERAYFAASWFAVA